MKTKPPDALSAFASGAAAARLDAVRGWLAAVAATGERARGPAGSQRRQAEAQAGVEAARRRQERQKGCERYRG